MCRSTLQHLTSILWISVALLPNLIPVQGVPLVLTLSDTPLLKQPATTSDAAHDGSSFTIQEDTAPTRISVSEAFSKPSLTLAAKISNFPDSGSQIVDEPTPDKPSSPQSVLATQTYVLSNKSSLEEAKEPSSRLHSTELPAITDTPVQTFEVTDAEITSLSPLSDVVGSTDSITTDSSISTVSTTIIASYTQPTAKPTFAVESMLTVENSDTFSSDISASIPFTSIAEITHLSRSSTLFVDRSSPVPLLSSPPPGETGVDIASILPTSTVDLPTPDHHAAIQSHTSINPNHDIISTQEQTHTLSDPHSLRIGVEILLSTESMSDGPSTISESSSILTFSINDQLSTTIPGSLPIVTAIPEPANSPSTTFQISSLSENSTKNSVKTQTSDGIPVSTDTTAIVVVLATSETIFDSATLSTTTSAGVSILDFTPTAIPTAFPTTLTPEQISSILAHTSLGFDPKILIVNLPSINQPDAPSPSTPIVVPAPAPSSAPPVEIPPAPLPQITLPIIISDVPVVIPSVIPLPQITPPIIISDVPVVIPSVIPLPQITPPIVISDAPVVIPSVIPLPQISIPTASETVVLPTNTPIQVSLPSQPTAFPTTLTPEQISSILAHTSLGFDPKILIVNLPSINQPDAPSPLTPIVVPAPAPSSVPPVEIPPAPFPQITLPIIISDIPVVVPSVIPLPQISIPTASETVVLPTNTLIQVSLPSQPTAFPTTLTPEQISSILAHTSLGFDPKILIVNLPSINQPDAPSSSTPIVVPAPIPSSAPPVEIPPAPLPQITLPIIISDVPVVIPSVIPLPQITPPIIISDVPVVIPSVIPLPQITPPIVISDVPVVVPSVIPLPQISIPTASETVVLPTNTPIQVSLPSQPTAFPTTLTPEQISSILAHTSLGFDPKILIVNLPSINQPDAPSPSTPIVVPAPIPSSVPPVEIPPAPLPQITLPIIISDVPVVIPSVIPLPQITPPIVISDVPVVIPSVIPLPQITPPIVISDVPVVIPSVIPLPQISIPTASETVVLPTNTLIQVSLPSQPTAFPTTLTPEQISSILAHTSLGFDPKILIVNLPSINQPDAPSPSTPIVVPAPIPSSVPPVEIPPAPLPQITLPIIISDVPVVIPSVIPLPQITPPIVISDVPVVIPSVIPLPQISIPTASETVVLPTNTLIQVSLPSQPTAFPTTLTPEQISSILAHTSLGFDPKILIVNLPSINQPDAPSPSTPIVVPAPIPSSVPPVEIPPAPLPQITLPIIISDVPVVIPSVIPLPQITPPIIISDVPVVIPSVIPLPQITPPIVISDAPVVIPSVIPLPQISIPTASETVVLPTNTLIQVSLPSQPTAFPTTLTPEQISSILAHTSLGFDPKILIVNLPSINQPDAPSPSTPIVVPAPIPSSVPPVEIPPAPLPQITPPIVISDAPVVIPSVIPLPQISIPTASETVVLPTNTLIQVSLPSQPTAFPTTLTPEQISSILAHTSLGFDPKILIVNLPSINQPDAPSPSTPIVVPAPIPSSVPPVEIPPAPLPQITPPIVISDVPVVIPSVIPLPQISIPTASETVVLPTNTLIQVSLPSQPTAFPTTLTPEQISSILAHTSLGFDPKILIVNLPSINQPDAPSPSTPIVVPAPIPSSVPPVEIPPAPLPQITLPIIISDVPVVIPSVIPLPQITPPIVISDVPVVIPSVIPLPQITPPIVISDVPVVIPSVIPLPQISIPTASETVVLPTNTLIQVSLPSQPTAFPTTLTPEQISSILAHTSLGFDPKILIVNLPSINQPDAPSPSTPIVVPAPIPSSVPPVEIPPAPLPQITPPIVISDAPVVIPSVIPLPQISIPTASETVVLPTNTLIQVSLPSQPTAFPTTLTPEQISSILAHTSLGFDPKILIVNLPSINQPDAPSSPSRLPPVLVSSTNGTPLPKDIPPLVSVFQPSFAPGPAATNTQENPSQPITSANTASGSALNITPNQRAGISVAITSPLSTGQTPVVESQPINTIGVSQAPDRSVEGNSQASVKLTLASTIISTDPSNSGSVPNTPVVSIPNASVPSGHGVFENPLAIPSATGVLPTGDTLIDGSMQSNQIESKSAPAGNVVANNPGGDIIVGGSQPKSPFSGKPGDSKADGGSSGHNGAGDAGTPSESLSGNNGMPVTVIEMLIGGVGIAFVILGSVLVVTRRGQALSPTFNAGMGPSEGGQNLGSTVGIAPASGTDTLKFSLAPLTGTKIPLGRVRSLSILSRPPPLNRIYVEGQSFIDMPPMTELSPNSSISTIYPSKQPKLVNSRSVLHHDERLTHMIDIVPTMGANAIEAEACSDCQLTPHTSPVLRSTFSNDGISVPAISRRVNCSSSYSNDGVYQTCMQLVPSKQSAYGNLGVPAYNDNMDMLHRDTTITAIPMGTKVGFPQDCDISSINLVSEYTDMTFESLPLQRRFSATESLISLKQSNISIRSGIEMSNTTHSWCISHISQPAMDDDIDEQFDPNQTFIEWRCGGQLPRALMTENPQSLAQDERVVEDSIPTGSQYDMHAITPSYEAESDSSWFDENTSGALSGAGIFAQTKHASGSARGSRHAMMATVEKDLGEFSLEFHAHQYNLHATSTQKSVKPRPFLRDDDYDMHTQSNGEWTINDTTVTGFEENSISSENTSALFSDCDDNQ